MIDPTLSRQQAQVRLDMSRQQAWEIMRDLGIAQHYVPGIVRTDWMSEQREGVGAVRRVFNKQERWVEERVVEWNPERGVVLALFDADLRQGPAPFAEAFFHYELADIGEESAAQSQPCCLCRLSLYYRMRWGTAGRLLGLAMTPLFILGQRTIAARLRKYYQQRAAGSGEG